LTRVGGACYRPVMRLWRAVWCTLASATLAVPAAATDLVTRPYACVEHLHRVEPGLDAHVVVVDLRCGQVDVVATRPRERHATVSTFAEEYGAQIAINANFYEASVLGVAMGDGVLWRDAGRDRHGASVAFGHGPAGVEARFFDSFDSARQCPFPWARQVVTGWPRLLRDGAVVFEPEEPIGMYRTHPRTALGLTPGGGHLVLAVIDGRRAGLPGVTSLEMLPLLEEFGVADAANLDGGGSSMLYIAREGGIVNRPSDRAERRVMNHLGIRITAAP
jgi:exopolysaccharide biosynthesis protein